MVREEVDKKIVPSSSSHPVNSITVKQTFSSSYEFKSQTTSTIIVSGTKDIKAPQFVSDESFIRGRGLPATNVKLISSQFNRYPSDHKTNLNYVSPYKNGGATYQSITKPVESKFISSAKPPYKAYTSLNAGVKPTSLKLSKGANSSSPAIGTPKTISSNSNSTIWNPLFNSSSKSAKTNVTNTTLKPTIGSCPSGKSSTGPLLRSCFSPSQQKPSHDNGRTIRLEPSITQISMVKQKSPANSTKVPGKVFIFNNDKFDSKSYTLPNRTGSTQDVALLTKTFRDLKLEVMVFENLTINEIKSVVSTLRKENFTNTICITFVLLSHGNRNNYISANDGAYHLDETILYPILDNPTLTLKPKIFFIQACRGERDPGTYEHDSAAPRGIPKNILKFYSTFEGYVALREQSGSPFIKSLCKHLQMYGSTEDIQSVMSRVITHVQTLTNHRQVPSYETNLTKSFRLGQTFEYL